MIAGAIIWSVVAILFFIIGFISRRSKKPVGFWANVKPPEVTDIRKFNRAVSNIWFVFAVGFELLGIPLYVLDEIDIGLYALVVISGIMILVIGIMVAYLLVENKYIKK